MNIDTEFKSLLTPLSEFEYNQLEENIIKNGCREPLVTWNDTLLDGHNRYEICQKHSISFKQEQIQLVDREEAEDWIDKNQLGRRNLTPDQFRLIIGRRLNRMNKKRGEHTGNQYTKMERCEKNHSKTVGRTREIIAKEHSVGAKIVYNAGKFAEAVDTLKDIAPEIEQKIRAGEPIQRHVIVSASQKVKDGDFEAAKAVLSGKTQSKKSLKYHPEVPEEYKQIFIDAIVFDDCLSLLSVIGEKIKPIKKKNPVLAWLPRDLFDGTLRRLRSLLREARPAAICPECNGLKCGHCNQNGFVNDSLNTVKEKDGNPETEIRND